MADLFVFEGYIDWRPNKWEYQKARLSECEVKIESAIKSLSLPDSFLRRNLQRCTSRKKNSISRIDKIRELLWHCLENGHDRTNPNKWNKYSRVKKEAKGKGLNANNVIWAHQYSRKDERYYDRRFCFYSWDPEDYYTLPNDNDGILIMNGQDYTPELELVAGGYPLLFSQPDIKRRKKALLGIILFDNVPSPLYPRPDLRFKLDKRTFEGVLEEMKGSGYFVD